MVVLMREGARGQCGSLMREGARGQCGCLDEGGCKRSVWLS